MPFKLDDIEEIAAKLTDLGSGIQRDLILIAGLPGTGKTTLAKEFARQTGAIHFDIDDIKRLVVPTDIVTEDIDPPNTVTSIMRRRYVTFHISLPKALQTL